MQITCIKNKFSTLYGIFPYNKRSTKTPAIPPNFNLNDFQKVLLRPFGVSVYISLLLWLESNCILFVGPDVTAEKLKFSIKDFFSKCDQIRSFVRIWSHLLKKSLMEKFIFCAVHASNSDYTDVITSEAATQRCS